MILGCFSEEGVGRADPGDDLRSWSSRFLNATSFSNFSCPGLNDLTLGVGYLGGVLGGYLDLGGRGGKDDSNIAPFLTTRLAEFTHLLLNVMRSKRFLSHLILTLS